MAWALIKETQAFLRVPLALGHHQGCTFCFHSKNARFVEEVTVMVHEWKKSHILRSYMFVFRFMFDLGIRAECDDRYGEFKPPAEWEHVHG